MIWLPPSQFNGIIRHYRIEYSTSSDVSHVDVDYPTIDFTIYGLRPFTQYTLRVAAFTVTLGEYSNELISVTKETSK